MKLQSANDFDVQVVGADSSSSFGIAMNAKAFRVLSSTLYQNKIGSIVREVSCNAVDAHIMADLADVPFEIHLPDMFEPWFAVRDFGVSMTHETVQKVLTRYFESTKDQSNDAIGAFGLGAKSPFSYTDQFTVTTWIKGQKTVYSAYVMSDGLPKLDVMHVEDSDEPRGVEVKISVKREDYNTFKREVVNQLQLFPVKPTITNGEVQWITYDYEVETELYKLIKSQYGNRGVVISQGNVGYPLYAENMKMADPAILNFIREISVNHKMIVPFPIGTIGVTASREGVEYDAKTVANIVDRLTLVRNEMGKAVNERLEAALNDFQRNIIFNDKLSSLQRSMIDTAKFAKVNFNRHVSIEKTLTDPNTKQFKFQFQVSMPSRKTLKYSSSVSKTVDACYAESIVYLLKDTTNRLQKRVDKLRGEIPAAMIYVVGPIGKETFTAAEITQFKADIEAETAGFNNVKAVSDIELPVAERKKYGRTGPTTKFILWDTDNSVEKVTDPIKEIEGDFIWMEVDRLVENQVINLAISQKIGLLRELQEEDGVDTLPVVIVNETGAKSIAKYFPEKVTVDSYFAAESAKYDTQFNKRKFFAHSVKSSVVSRMDYCARDFLRSIPEDVITVDREVNRLASYIRKFQNVVIPKRIVTISKMLGWNYSPEFAATMSTYSELAQKKLMKLAESNIVTKWYFNDSYSASRLPDSDMKVMFEVYARSKNRV